MTQLYIDNCQRIRVRRLNRIERAEGVGVFRQRRE